MVLACLAAGCSSGPSGNPPPATAAAPAEGLIQGVQWLKDQPEAVAILEKQGFVITSEARPYIHEFYDWMYLWETQVERRHGAPRPAGQEADPGQTPPPPLVTCDSLVHAYNSIYLDALRDLERVQARRLKRWLARQWTDLPVWGRAVRGAADLPTAERLCGILAVASKLLDPAWTQAAVVDPPAWVDEEIRRVQAGAGQMKSPAWDREVEYSAFVPRGMYAREEGLARFFRAWAWLSHCPLRAENEQELAMACELAPPPRPRGDARGVSARLSGQDDDDEAPVAPRHGDDTPSQAETPREELERLWEKRPRWESRPSLDWAYRELLGGADDPRIEDLGAALAEAGSKWVDHDAMGMKITRQEPDRVRALAILRERFGARIRTGDAFGELREPGRDLNIYILSPIYVFDNEVFTLETAAPRLKTYMPGGLDFLAGLGSDYARRMVLCGVSAEVRTEIDGQLLKARASRRGNSRIGEIAALTHGVFEALAEPDVGATHPPFMKTDAYRRKSIQTALAAWAEHRHQWLLHAKSLGVLGGGDVEFDVPPGFVEPNIECWRRLLDLTAATRDALRIAGAGEDPRWEKLLLLETHALRIAMRQLAGEWVTAGDREFFAMFGRRLAILMGFREVSALPLRAEPVVADIYRAVLTRQVVHVGTGLPQAMYAVFPYRGKWWLCRGGVMTYRECVAGDGRTLTDDVWLKMLASKDPPPAPAWTRDFVLLPKPRPWTPDELSDTEAAEPKTP
jgi:hypothetical protein